MRGERVFDRGRVRRDGLQRVVVDAGEPVGDLPRDRYKVGQFLRVWHERGWPGARDAISLTGEGELPRVAQDNVGVRSTSRTEADGGPEREVVDEDHVRSDLSDDIDRLTRGLDGFPQQIPGSRLCLVAKRRDHAHAGGLEERSQVGVLAGRLLFGTGDAGIRPSAHGKSGELHARSSHQRSHRGPGGHDDFLLPRVAPGPSDADQRYGMRCVVRADDQQRHDAIKFAGTDPDTAVDRRHDPRHSGYVVSGSDRFGGVFGTTGPAGEVEEHLLHRAPVPPDRPCRPATQSGLPRHMSPARLPAAPRPEVRRPTPPRSRGRTPPCDSRRHMRRLDRSTDRRRALLQPAAARPRRWAGGPAGRGLLRDPVGLPVPPGSGPARSASAGFGSSSSPPTMTRVALARNAGSRGEHLGELGHPLQLMQPTDGQHDR